MDAKSPGKSNQGLTFRLLSLELKVPPGLLEGTRGAQDSVKSPEKHKSTTHSWCISRKLSSRSYSLPPFMGLDPRPQPLFRTR